MEKRLPLLHLTWIIRYVLRRPCFHCILRFFLQVWPSNCFEHTQGPYSKINEDDLSDGVTCIDRRTKEYRKLQLYSDVREICEWCIDNNVVLTICSGTPSRELVEEILTSFNMLEWFFMPQVFKGRKSYHFRNLFEYSGSKAESFLFFDDSASNIEVCNSIGVTSVLVDGQVGLTWDSFLKGLKTYSSKFKKARLGSWNSLSSGSTDEESGRTRNHNVEVEEEGSDSDHSVFESHPR